MKQKRFAPLFLVLLGMTAVIWMNARISTAQSDDHFFYLPIIHTPDPPRIITFDANVSIANPGDTITLSWETENASQITLYHLLASGQFGTFWNVGPQGQMAYTIPDSTRNSERFILYAGNNPSDTVSAMVSITLNCPYGWFFAPEPPICAQEAPIISAAAEQRFEYGTMIWVGEEDRIYVLYDDDISSPKWSAFEDEWEPGDPIDDPSIQPPPGFYQPKYGFGLVWREQPQVRDRLGWALAEEEGYTTAVQRTSYYRYNETYILALDNDIWLLEPEHSGWEKFTPIHLVRATPCDHTHPGNVSGNFADSHESMPIQP